jgi:hypothetical protein
MEVLDSRYCANYSFRQSLLRYDEKELRLFRKPRLFIYSGSWS